MNKERPHAAPQPASSHGGPPSDLELMMLYDGELEEPRKSQVAAYLNSDLAARGKVSGLRITSVLVQRQVNAASPADNIADLVMGKIATNGASTHTATAPVAPSPPLAIQPLPTPARAANDNKSRRLYIAVSAVVAAAAAALAIWSRQPVSGVSGQTKQPVAALSTQQAPIRPAPVSPPPAEPEIDGASVNPEAESEHGVEVAAVNFGAHMGSIFYVPSGSIEAKRTTTVVWLADDAGE